MPQLENYIYPSLESITYHKKPRMTNHSAYGRCGRVNNTRHETCLTDSLWYMVMRNGLFKNFRYIEDQIGGNDEVHHGDDNG